MNKARLLVVVASLSMQFVASPALACIFNCTYTQTQYPIVLAHGAIGYQSLFGVADYWYGFVDALEDGGATAFVTNVSPFNSTEERGEELLAQVEDILALTGASKVNLIGHAQGGMDARYVAAVAPQLVASVTTIATPHTGSAPFQLLSSVVGPPGNGPQPIINLADALLAAVYKYIAGNAPNIDVRASAKSLSYAGAAQFNSAHPAGMPTTACGQGAASANGIRFYSWSGTALLTNVLDLSDPLFAPLAALVPGQQTEGFTERCSSHFGTVIRDNYFFNHLDSVNNVLGLRSPLAPDPLALIRAHANRLKLLGL